MEQNEITRNKRTRKPFVTVLVSVLAAALAAFVLLPITSTKTLAAELTAGSWEELETVIASASDGDTVIISSDMDATKTIVIDKNITIKANDKKTIWSSTTGADFPMFTVNSGKLTLGNNVTLTGKTHSCGEEGTFNVVWKNGVEGNPKEATENNVRVGATIGKTLNAQQLTDWKPGDGYTFTGWKWVTPDGTQGSSVGTSNINTTGYKVPANTYGTMTVVAQWEKPGAPVGEYKVIWSNGMDGNNRKEIEETANAGDTLTKAPSSLPDGWGPEGYTFKGWKIEGRDTAGKNDGNTGYTVPADTYGTIRVVAEWEKVEGPKALTSWADVKANEPVLLGEMNADGTPTGVFFGIENASDSWAGDTKGYWFTQSDPNDWGWGADWRKVTINGPGYVARDLRPGYGNQVSQTDDADVARLMINGAKFYISGNGVPLSNGLPRNYYDGVQGYYPDEQGDKRTMYRYRFYIDTNGALYTSAGGVNGRNLTYLVKDGSGFKETQVNRDTPPQGTIGLFKSSLDSSTTPYPMGDTPGWTDSEGGGTGQPESYTSNVQPSWTAQSGASQGCDENCPTYTNSTFSGGTVDNEKAFFVQVENGTLNIDGATLRDFVTDATVKYAAPVVVKGGSFNMISGSIEHNSVGYTVGNNNYASKLTANQIEDKVKKEWPRTDTAGAVILSGGAEGTISGGKIDGNRADTGAIVVQGSGTENAYTDTNNLTTLLLTGGEVNNNVGVHYSGGIYVYNGGIAQMGEANDPGNAKLTNNFSWNRGGAVYAAEEVFGSTKWGQKGTTKYVGEAGFVMYGGEISGNMAVSRAGAIEVMSNHVVLVSGTIKENASRVLGGAIYVEGDGVDRMYTLVIQKGCITDNTAVGRVDNATLGRIFTKPTTPDGGACAFENDLGTSKVNATSVYDRRDYGGYYGHGGGIWLCSFGGNATFNISDTFNVIVDSNTAATKGTDVHVHVAKGGSPNGVNIVSSGNNNFVDEKNGNALKDGTHYPGILSVRNEDNYNQQTCPAAGGVMMYGNVASNGGAIAANGTVVFGDNTDVYVPMSYAKITKTWADNVEHEVPLTLQYWLLDDQGNRVEALEGYGVTFNEVPDTKAEGEEVGADQYGENAFTWEQVENGKSFAEMAIPWTVVRNDGTTVPTFTLKTAAPVTINYTDANGQAKTFTGSVLDPSKPEHIEALWHGQNQKVFDANPLSIDKWNLEIVETGASGQEMTYKLGKMDQFVRIDAFSSTSETFYDKARHELATINTFPLQFNFDTEIINGENEEEVPEPEKYINNKVHESLDFFDEKFEYEIMAYVPADATEVTISDTLEATLEFVNKTPATVLSAVQMYTDNDHKGDGTGTVSTSNYFRNAAQVAKNARSVVAPVSVDGQTVSLTLKEAFLKEVRTQDAAKLDADGGFWVKMSFMAKYSKDYYDLKKVQEHDSWLGDDADKAGKLDYVRNNAEVKARGNDKPYVMKLGDKYYLSQSGDGHGSKWTELSADDAWVTSYNKGDLKTVITADRITGTDGIYGYNGTVLDAQEPHHGTLNQGSYKLTRGNSSTSEYKTNIVTVEPKTEDLTITKVWDDAENVNQLRPSIEDFAQKLKVQRVKGNEKTDMDPQPVPEITESDNNTWTATWTGLAKLEGVTYQVVETKIDNYKAPEGSPAVNGGTIKNKLDDATPVAITIEGKKVLKNAAGNRDQMTLEAGAFEFALYEVDSADAAVPGDAEPLQTANNGAGDEVDTFRFEEINYNTEGTHYYVVKELTGSDQTMTLTSPESNEYRFTVVVTREGTVLKTDAAENKISVGTFTNTYTQPDVTPVELKLTAKKSLENAELKDNMFTFELRQGDKLIDSPKNKDENVTFKKIKFAAAGTYTYTVKEKVVTGDGITYDASEKTIEVVVKENAEDPDNKFLYIENVTNDTVDVGTFTNVKGELEKYIEKDVDATLKNPQEVFTFDVIGYVAKDATSVTITDELVDALELVPGTIKVQAQETNDHKVEGTVKQPGTPITTFEDGTDGKTVQIVIDDDAELAKLRGKWVQLTFDARLTADAIDAFAKNDRDALAYLGFTEVTDNGSVTGGAPSHDGILNLATYAVGLPNDGVVEDKSNTVTVEPSFTEITIEKKWQDVAGNALAAAMIPEDEVTLEVLADDKPMEPALIQKVNKSSNWKAVIKELPKYKLGADGRVPENAKAIVYTVREISEITGFASEVDGVTVINKKNEEPEIEKYVNKKSAEGTAKDGGVHTDLSAFDEVYTYDIQAYIAKDATVAEITDELKNVLEFVGEAPTAVVVKDGEADGTAPKLSDEGTAPEDEYKIDEAAWTAGKLVFTLGNADSTEVLKSAGKWLQITFDAKIKDDYRSIEALIKAGADVWTVVAENEPIDDAKVDNDFSGAEIENHEGIANDSSYRMKKAGAEVGNEWQYEDKSNTVTVQPKTTKVYAQKTWQDENGEVADWPQDVKSVTVNIYGADKKKAVDTITLTNGDKVDSNELPVLENVTYTVDEVEIPGYEEVEEVTGTGTVDDPYIFTNKKEGTLVVPEEPEIEKYVNKKDATVEQRAGTVHTDLSAFDEVYTYDIQAYITKDATHVVVTDELVEVLEFVGDRPIEVVAIDGDGEDGRTAPALSKEAEPGSGVAYEFDKDAWNTGKLILTLGDEEVTEPIAIAGQWLRITFDAKIKDEYRSIEALKGKGVNVWTKITENEPVDDADTTTEFSGATKDSHEGIINDASYTINKLAAGADVDNEWQYKDKSNTVTVQPKTTKVYAQKTWQDENGNPAEWPQDVKAVTVNVYGADENTPVDTIILKDGNKLDSKELPVLEGVAYTVDEVAIPGYTEEGSVKGSGTDEDPFIFTNGKNGGPQIEKYVNDNVHQKLGEFDSLIKYDILAFVPVDADEIVIKDTLVNALEFADGTGAKDAAAAASTDKAKVVTAVVAKAENDHKVNGTVKATDGTALGNAADVKIDGKEMTVTVADAKAYRGQYIQVTFWAKYTKATIDAAQAGDVKTVTGNGAVLKGANSHTGTTNDAGYDIRVGNDWTKEHKSNTVTVEAETTKLEAEKKWKNADGTDAQWPEGVDEVKINVLKGDDVVDTITLTKDKAKNSSKELAKLKGVTYTLAEVEVPGYTTTVDGTVFTNTELVPEIPEEPEIEKYVNKKSDEGTAKDGGVHTDLAAFDEVYTYDIQAYITKDAKYVEIIDQLNEVLDFTLSPLDTFSVVVKDGEGEDGKTAPKLSKAGEPIDDWSADFGTGKPGQLVVMMGDPKAQDVLPYAGKWIQITFDARIKDEYRSIEKIKGVEGAWVTVTENDPIDDETTDELPDSAEPDKSKVDNHAGIGNEASYNINIGVDNAHTYNDKSNVVTVKPAVTKVYAQKTWKDEHGKTAAWPQDVESVTVNVYGADENTPVDTITLKDGNKLDSKELPVLEGVTYTVDEVAIPGYTEEGSVKGSGTDEDPFIFTNGKNGGPQIEKYVNDNVHQKLGEFDSLIKYDILAFVPVDADEIVIRDTLVNALEFADGTGAKDAAAVASTDKAKVVTAVVAKTQNDHKVNGTVKATNGTALGNAADVKIDGREMTVTVADAKAYRGQYIQVTFWAKYTQETIDAAKAGDVKTVTGNGAVLGGANNHTGTTNDAGYDIRVGNDWTKDHKSNTVTVEAETTKLEAEKKWKNADGTDAQWPEGVTEVKINVLKGDEVVDTITLTKDKAKNSSKELAKLKGVTYTLAEVEVPGYTTTVDGTVFTNTEIVPEIPEEPKIEKYVNKKYDDLTNAERDGTVHTDLSAFDEVYTYDIQSYVTSDAGYVVITDELAEVLEIVGDSTAITAYVKDGEGADGKTAPKLTKAGVDVSEITEYNTEIKAVDGVQTLVVEIGDEASTDVLPVAGKWIQVTFDAKIKDEYRSIDALKAKGAKVWTTITEDAPIDDADTTTEFSGAKAGDHEGIVNDASYKIKKAAAGAEIGNEWYDEHKSNTVTVQPGTTKVYAQKTWQDENGNPAEWPQDVKAVTVNVYGADKESAVDTFTLTNGEAVDSKELPVLENVIYTVAEVEIPGYTEVKEVTGAGTEADPFVFTNKKDYEPEETKHKIKISKSSLGGSEIAGAEITVRNENGVVDSWTSTTEAHELELAPGRYVMVEVVAPDGYQQVTTEMVFVVDEEGRVTLETTQVDGGGRVTAENDHINLEDAPIAPTSVVIEAEKLFDGELTAGKFTFELSKDGTKLQTKTNDAAGKVTFDAIDFTFDETGTHTFVISEVNDGKEGIIYDTSLKSVNVNVTKASRGEGLNRADVLEAEVDYGEAAKAVFTNKEIRPGMAYASITANKALKVNGTDAAPAAGEFEFVLELEGHPAKQAANNADGLIDFGTFEFGEAGEYSFTIRELNTGDETVTYDGTVYSGTVNVTEGEPVTAEDGTVTKALVADIVLPQGGITFTNNKTDKKPVTISKTDITTGRELPGATLIVTDASGAEIERWVSTSEAHTVELKPGTYTLTEITAPDGYSIAESIVFTVDANGLVGGDKVVMENSAGNIREMYNISVTIDKKWQDGHGRFVEWPDGVSVEFTLQYFDRIDNKWVDYALHDKVTLTPESQVAVFEDLPAEIDGAPAQFRAVETKLEGYTQATSTATDIANKNGTMTAVNIPEIPFEEEFDVKISKNSLGGTEIAGAHIVVYDAAGNVVEEWDSTTKAHELTLKPGTYTMVETVAPEGYKQVTTAITFTVDNDGHVTLGTTVVDNGGRISVMDANHIILEDAPEDIPTRPVKISKTDLGGTEIEGAHIVIKDADGKVVDTWTSDKTIHEIQLSEGTYTLIEEVAPEGYERVKTAIQFTVDKDGKVTLLTSEVEGGEVEYKDGVLVLKDAPLKETPQDKEKPETPTKERKEVPSTTRRVVTPSAKSGTAVSRASSTGDSNNTVLWIVLAASAAAALTGAALYVRRRRKI